MRRLPFLNGVRAFEAAARLGGFAAAADELHVSPAAISRMVKLLEERLGVALFERRANRLVATPAGEAYRAGLGPILDSLASLTDSITARGDERAITVGVGPTFAIRWLIPRLADFRARHPTLEVRITTGGMTTAFSDDWTCGILLAATPPQGFAALPLFEATLTPVCAPARAASLKTPGDLDPEDLLRVAHAPEDWERWAAAAGLDRLAPHGPEVGYYGQALQAAADGLGVAMGIRPYIDDDLAAGRLVAPFDISVAKDRRWYLAHRPRRAAEPALVAFKEWLTETAAPVGQR
jgi:LysR family glycine cleavage system transcriptional activator